MRKCNNFFGVNYAFKTGYIIISAWACVFVCVPGHLIKPEDGRAAQKGHGDTW